MSLHLQDRHLVLVGMMGAGKTTVGGLLAARLGRPFLDSDEAIEARTGRTVAEIFADDGEPAFRTLETQVLTQMLESNAPAVIAAAGGTVMDPTNRRRMSEHAEVVWLRADPGVLTSRVQTGTHRPLLEHDPAATLQRLADERADLYSSVADLTIDVDERPPTAVVDAIVSSVEVSA